MGFEPYSQNVRRYGRTFQVLSPGSVPSNFFFMAAATTGVAGHVVKYSTEDTVVIATSGNKNYEIAGFLLQDVKDLDAGPVKGYRNLNNTVANLGENIGVLQGDGHICYTKQYNGTPAVGNRLCVNDSTGNLTVFTALMTGDPIAVVEAITSSVPSNVEPTQYAVSQTGNNFIRIRVYNL